MQYYIQYNTMLLCKTIKQLFLTRIFFFLFKLEKPRQFIYLDLWSYITLERLHIFSMEPLIQKARGGTRFPLTYFHLFIMQGDNQIEFNKTKTSINSPERETERDRERERG